MCANELASEISAPELDSSGLFDTRRRSAGGRDDEPCLDEGKRNGGLLETSADIA